MGEAGRISEEQELKVEVTVKGGRLEETLYLTHPGVDSDGIMTKMGY